MGLRAVFTISFLSSVLVHRAVVGQATDATIQGLVADTTGRPLDLTVIDLLHQPTGRHLTVTTDRTGRFAFWQIPIGGPYLLRARRIGYRPAEERVANLLVGDHRWIDVRLTPSPVALQPLVVSEETAARADRAGGSTVIEPRQIRSLPTANYNYSDLASLSPLAGPQLSLGGQKWTQTEYRLDGVRSTNVLRAGEYNAGPFGPPLEAIREFEVNTNVYDVTEGRQGGGEVAAVTKTGTNTWESTAFTSYRSQSLGAAADYQGRTRDARPFTTVFWGGSIGGPIVRDRLHLFAALERQDGSSPLLVGLLDTPAAEVAAGIARDSLARIVSILSSKYGTSSPNDQLGRLPRSPTATSLFGRLDWSLSPTEQLTARHLFSRWDNPLSGGVDQPIALREARSDFSSTEHQAFASLRSTFSARSQNELRLGISSSERKLVPVSQGVPRGFVQVRSTLPDGTTGNTTIQFGGNRLAPDLSREWQVQLSDRWYRQLGAVDLTVGTDNAMSGLNTTIAESQTGLFTFPSIAALDNELPTRFQRTVPLTGAAPASALTVLDVSAFAQAAWRPSAKLAVKAGFRWDGTGSLSRPAANPLVLSALGKRTDVLAGDWFTLSPRAEIVWDPNADGSRIVRLGAGLFAANLPAYEYHNELLNTGLTLADIDLRGSAVPAPDFPEYRSNPSTVPGVPAGLGVAPFVNLVGDDFKSPTTWKTSLSYRHRLSSAFTATVSGMASWTRNQYYFVDRNLRSAPAFILDNEGGRGVYVPASTITATGLADVHNATANPSLARVLSLESPGRGRAYSATAELSFRPRSGRGRLDLSYAWTNAYDNSTFGCCLARTAASFTPILTDPRDLASTWAPSDLEVRHRIVASGFVDGPWKSLLAGRLVAQSGRRFSLTVDGDLNGDEVNGNDLAFLFDPSNPSTPADVGASMQRILANPNNLAAGYIRDHLGQVATRNALVLPWSVRLDLRLAKALPIPGRSRITAIVDLFNALNLVDSDWGAERQLPLGISSQNPIVNRINLLRIVGFDQATRRYTYAVNELAGVLPKGGDPYQFQIGLRFDH
jgi:hypothetical protein